MELIWTCYGFDIVLTQGKCGLDMGKYVLSLRLKFNGSSVDLPGQV